MAVDVNIPSSQYSGQLFLRKCKLTFSDNSIDPIEDLRIAFEVEKNDGEKANHGMIIIYNLNQTHRNRLSKPLPIYTPYFKAVKITLHAGYNDDLVQLIAGDLLEVRHNRVGPDWVTELSIFSGLEVANKSYTNISYNNTTQSKKIIDDILAPTGMDIKYTSEALDAILGKTQPYYAESTLSMLAAQNFLFPYDLELTIEEDGQCLVYKKLTPREKSATSNANNTISKKTGMIGSPRINKSGATIKMLLRPSIKLLQKVFIDSDSINDTTIGDYRLNSEFYVKQITHVGDTHSDDWYTELEVYYAAIKDNAAELGYLAP